MLWEEWQMQRVTAGKSVCYIPKVDVGIIYFDIVPCGM